MARADVTPSRSSNSNKPGVNMDSHTKRPFSRDQPGKRSVSGGGDGGGAGLGHPSRSHTLDTIPGLGSPSKSRSRHGRNNNNNTSSSNNGHIGSYHNNNNNNQHLSNRQHYQHKHSRVVASNANKTNTGGSNNNNHQNGSSDAVQTDHGADHGNSKDANLSNNNSNNRSNKKFSRRTVSLPKAGSRLFGHAHHAHHAHNQLSSGPDGTNRHSTSNGINNNTSGNILISSATTQSHHSIISSGVNNNNISNNHNTDNNSNNVFPPIAAVPQVVTTSLEAGGGGAMDQEGRVKGEPSSLSPRNLPGASRTGTREGGVAVPTSPPEVPLSRLHFLTEPTFESLHPRTPPIFSLHGMANGVAGGGVEGGGANGTLAANMPRNSALSPDLNGTNQHQGQKYHHHQQQQHQPFSPSSTSEKAKGKFEKKIQLSKPADDSRSSPQHVASSPRTKTGNTGDNTTTNTNNNNNNTNQNTTTKSNSKEAAASSKIRQKKDSITTTKSLPKITPPEEPFSIRRKIEQFRKWHEEQYVDKLAKFETDVSGKEGLRGVSYGNPQTGSFGLVDYTKVLEGRIAAGETTGDAGDVGGKTSVGVAPKPHFQHFGRGPEQTWMRKQHATVIVNGADREVRGHGALDVTHTVRPTSAVTWKTWRDVNTSDAYKDVKKYIKDNDLMDEERETWIKSWIADVEMAMGGPVEQERSVVTVTQR